MGSGPDNVTGSSNTYIGYDSGISLDGNANICIGNESGPTSSQTSSNLLFIDIETTDNPLIYGEFDNDFIKINGTFEVTAGLSNPSDVNLKSNFKQLDKSEVLEKVSQLNISEWTYKSTPEVRHVGPTAQEFYSKFNLGQDDKSIHTIDSNGIALVAIQELINLTNTLKNEIIELKSEFEQLKGIKGKLKK